MSDILDISQCNIAQLLGESNRFLFHVVLIHISTCILDGKGNYFSDELFRSLLLTAMAIVLYNLFFRKIIEPKIEKMKLVCVDNEEKMEKKRELDEQDIFVSKKKKQLNEWTKKEREKHKKRDIYDSKVKKRYANTPRNYSTRYRVLFDKTDRK